MKRFLFFVCMLPAFSIVNAQQKFNGIDVGLNNLYRLSDAKTRSISPENFTGAKGEGGKATKGTGAIPSRDLGQGWKISPSVVIHGKNTFTMAEINTSGSIQHIWMTPTGTWRYSIFRIYYDDETTPSVEVPVGDFFCMGWNQYSPLRSLAVCVNPGSAFNCYWPMPFREKSKITMENIDDKDMVLYYQVDDLLKEVPSYLPYFHAQFRRVNPLPYKQNYVLVDSIQGKGQYVGTYLAWGVHNNGWWGEGEIKFFMDGDTDFPTICGTGTEDYFGGAYDWDVDGQYVTYSTPHLGLHQVLRPDGLYRSQMRFGMYRWHIPDPIRFRRDLRVSLQALGWRAGGRYLPLQCDIASVAYW